MRYFFILMGIMITYQIKGQTIIEGSTFNQRSQKLPFCTIKFLSVKDSALIQVVSSDSIGQYTSQIRGVDSILIGASFIGYQEVFSLIVIDSTKLETKIIHKDLILLNDDNILNEVEVVAKKTVFEKKIDRFVFNIENTAIVDGNSIYEVLAKTPLVQVIGNNISVIGKGSAGILLNDKYFYLSGEDLINFLKSIPAENIERIEVITNPPARYAASGGALINIVTKRNLLPGTNGTAYSTYTQAFLSNWASWISFK